MNIKETIAERFAGFVWHDSVLKSINIERSDAEYDVRLIVRMSGGSNENFTDTEVHFVRTRAISTGIDLLALKLCSGMIWDANCCTDITNLETSKIDLESLPDLAPDTIDLDKMVVFTISLIPPSGSLVVLAEDFHTYVG